MPFEIIHDDIARVNADAIVCPIGPLDRPGIRVASLESAENGAISEAVAAYGSISVGEVAQVDGSAIGVKYIVSTALPVRAASDALGTLSLLGKCCLSALEKASSLGCQSVALPLLGEDIDRLSKADVLSVVLDSITKFLCSSDMLVLLMIDNNRSFRLPDKWTDGLDTYLEENLKHSSKRLPFPETWGQMQMRNAAKAVGIKAKTYADLRLLLTQEELDMRSWDAPLSSEEEELHEFLRKALAYAQGMVMGCDDPWTNLHFKPDDGESLDTWLANTAKTFRQVLAEFMWEKHLSSNEVYQRANLDRKLFSKLSGSDSYHPNKRTCLALCIGLELDVDQSRVLLQRAGWAFNPTDRMDMIVLYYISRKMYNIDRINAVLYKHKEEQLGSGWRVHKKGEVLTVNNLAASDASRGTHATGREVLKH